MNRVELLPLDHDSLKYCDLLLQEYYEEPLHKTNTMHWFFEQLDAIRRHDQTLIERLRQEIFIAVKADVAIGVCRIEKYPEYICNGNIGYYVTPSERRKGNSKIIISLIEEKCEEKGYANIYAVAGTHNEPSIRSLRSMNWVETGVIYQWNYGQFGREFQIPKK